MTAKVTKDAWSIFILRVQNLHRIKQRKGLCFIQALSNDVDDQDDDLITPYTLQDYHHPNAITTEVHPC